MLLKTLQHYHILGQLDLLLSVFPARLHRSRHPFVPILDDGAQSVLSLLDHLCLMVSQVRRAWPWQIRVRREGWPVRH